MLPFSTCVAHTGHVTFSSTQSTPWVRSIMHGLPDDVPVHTFTPLLLPPVANGLSGVDPVQVTALLCPGLPGVPLLGVLAVATC